MLPQDPLLQTHHKVPDIVHGVIVCPTRPCRAGTPVSSCSGRVNRPSAKVLPLANHRHGQNACTAQAPPRPAGGKRTRSR